MRRVLSIGIRHATTAAMWAVIQHNVRLALILFQGRREFAENCEAWVIAPTLHTPGRVRLSHGRYAVIYQLPGFKIYWYHQAMKCHQLIKEEQSQLVTCIPLCLSHYI